MTFGSFRLNTLSAALAATNSVTASGGTISYYSIGTTSYKIHAFTTAGSGSFVVSAVSGSPTIDALIVGGGGASGSGQTSSPSGGGGAGQVILQTGLSVSAQTYSLTIGAAGTAPGVANTNGGNGGSSIALGYTATGGGGGGWGGAANAGAGSSGASGGGGGGAGGTTGISRAGGTATSSGVTGYAGGAGSYFGSGTAGSGGGGGFGGVGGAASNPSQSQGGNGGAGYTTTFVTGSNYILAAGGGGGGSANGITFSTNPGSGAASTTSVNGSTGSSGGVYIRYQVPYVASVAYVTSVNSGTTSLTFPTIQAGDIAVYGCTAINTTTTIPTSVTPTGFTLLSSATVGSTLGTRVEIFYKICNGTESATTLTNMSGTRLTFSNMVIYRPSSTVNSLVFSTPSIQATDSAPTNQTLTMTGLTGPYIGFAWGSRSDFSGTLTSTGATRTRSSLGGSSGGWNTYEATSSAVSFSTATLSMTDTGTNTMASFTMRIY